MSARDRFIRILPALLAGVVWIGIAFGRAPSVDDLFEQLAAGGPDEKKHALQIIGSLQRGDLTPRVAPYLSDPDLSVRREAVRAIGRGRNPEAAGLLAQALQQKPLKEKALEAILEAKAIGALPEVRAAAEDPSPKIRKLAMKVAKQLESWSNQYHIKGPDGKIYGRRSEIVPDLEALWGIPDPGKAAAP